jgi:hypothetical protein
VFYRSVKLAIPKELSNQIETDDPLQTELHLQGNYHTFIGKYPMRTISIRGIALLFCG